MRRCIICDHTVEDDTVGLSACPMCGSIGTPSDPAQDVTIRINWHELRILCIWAEFHANAHEKTSSPGSSMQQTVFSITRRLEVQHPFQPPLTLGGELRQLAKEYSGMETNIPHAEGFDPTEEGKEG